MFEWMVNEWVDGRLDGPMDICLDEWVDGWMPR